MTLWCKRETLEISTQREGENSVSKFLVSAAVTTLFVLGQLGVAQTTTEVSATGQQDAAFSAPVVAAGHAPMDRGGFCKFLRFC